MLAHLLVALLQRLSFLSDLRADVVRSDCCSEIRTTGYSRMCQEGNEPAQPHNRSGTELIVGTYPLSTPLTACCHPRWENTPATLKQCKTGVKSVTVGAALSLLPKILIILFPFGCDWVAAGLQHFLQIIYELTVEIVHQDIGPWVDRLGITWNHLCRDRLSIKAWALASVNIGDKVLGRMLQ